MSDGGYDEGYLSVPCLWGLSPGSLVQRFIAQNRISPTYRVLDLGCGEGKNAVPFASRGCQVDAVDCSSAALENAGRAHPIAPVRWIQADAIEFEILPRSYDLIIAYGLLHCLKNDKAVALLINNMQNGTKLGGFNIICVFNDRSHELSAHPNFSPCLLPHAFYVERYSHWETLDVSDEDLFETHPHNNIPHHHSLSRLIARRTA
ncbi:class I SAM-dependent methyltransferase [Methylobacterium sp. C1]|uniref:class I SAM-dependent methyltransferase n=1 Tax=Methylobacterium sp. C1 TaxID=1479019 RepID=UPI0009F1FA96|nr:class I SAM-dependent methyltransferase [Methylobacterium sp. C1]